MYTTHVRSVAAIRFLEEGSHNVKMKQLRARGRCPEDLDARADHLERRVLRPAPPRMGPPARRHGGARRCHHRWEETRVAPWGRVARSIERGAPVPATRQGAAEVPHRHPDLAAAGQALWRPGPWAGIDEARSHRVHRLRASPSGPRALRFPARAHVPD